MVAGVVDHGGTGQQELKKKKRKKKKSTKQVAQQSKAVLWLMEITSFCEKDLVELTNNFKTIAKDTTTGLRAKGNGNTIDGGGDDLLSREEFVGHFSKVMKVSEDEAGVLFEAADSDDSGFVDYMCATRSDQIRIVIRIAGCSEAVACQLQGVSPLLF